MKYDAFISYKRQGGSVWASLVRAILKQKLIPCMDVHKKKGSNDWWNDLKNDIMDSYCVIMVLTKDVEKTLYDGRDYYLEELEFAKENGKTIIPFFSHDCCMTDFHDNRLINILQSCESSLQYKVEDPDITYTNMFSFINSHLELIIFSDEDCIYDYSIGNEYVGCGDIEKNGTSLIIIPRNYIGLLHIEINTINGNDANIRYDVHVNDDNRNRRDRYTMYWNTQKDLKQDIKIKWKLHRDYRHRTESIMSQTPKPSLLTNNVMNELGIL